MQLEEFLDDKLGIEPGHDLSIAGPISVRIQRLTQDPFLTQALVANTFWQAFIFSGASPFAERRRKVAYILRGDEVRREPFDAPEIYVVCHARKIGQFPRYNLLVIDPLAKNDIVLDVQVLDAQLRDGWRRFATEAGVAQYSNDPGPLGEIAREGMVLASEANRTEKFRILVTSRGTGDRGETPHEVISTARVPNSAILTENDQNGTVGVIATNTAGVIGATIAAHTVPVSEATAKIGASRGPIVSRNELTDSCFVEIDPNMIALKGTAVPLQGASLSPMKEVAFDGCVAGPVSTHLTGWSPELPFLIPLVQLRVLTNAVTNPGDSGAALLTKSDEVVGFSLARSGYGQPVEYSIWIWAQSVFLAHDLT